MRLMIVIGLSGLFGVVGAGCVSSVSTEEERRVEVVTVRPATRPAPLVKRVATTAPVVVKPLPVRVMKPVAAVKPKPAPPKVTVEFWDGRGSCEGIASWYAGKFLGRKTANGEVYTGKKLTAAHRVLAFGTKVRVTNLENGLDVVVRINDRGPFVAGRVIDLSPAAAGKLRMLRRGVVKVRLEVEG
jgi:rare lipoprotein A